MLNPVNITAVGTMSCHWQLLIAFHEFTKKPVKYIFMKCLINRQAF